MSKISGYATATLDASLTGAQKLTSLNQSVNFQSGLSGAITARTTNWVVSVDSRDMNDCSNKKNMYHHLQRGQHARKTIASFVRVTRQNVWS